MRFQFLAAWALLTWVLLGHDVQPRVAKPFGTPVQDPTGLDKRAAKSAAPRPPPAALPPAVKSAAPAPRPNTPSKPSTPGNGDQDKPTRQLCGPRPKSKSSTPKKLQPATQQKGKPAQCGEGAQQICYGLDGGSPQNIDLEDLQYVADFLHFTGQTNAGGPGAFYTMPASVFCAEWSIEVPGAGTVLPLAKKNNARITSSVLFTDIADAIDGGVGATEEQKKAALMGCAANGGQIGVKTDPANPLYNTKEYKDSKAKPEGIVLKIVRAPGSKKL